jgi:peroxiredoxin
MTNRVQIDQPAPDFSLKDADGQKIKLSDFRDKSNVLLVFNRGFM